MSDKWLNIQHDEVKERNRQRRMAEAAEARRLSEERAERARRRSN